MIFIQDKTNIRDGCTAVKYSFKLKASIDNSGAISQKLVVGVVNADRLMLTEH